jgi:hypothetical protein
VKITCICICILVSLLVITVLGQASFVQQPKEAATKSDADTSLRKAVEHFIASADKVDVEAVAAAYDPAFTCVRVADEGGVVRLSRDQILQVFKRAGGPYAPDEGHDDPPC